MTKAETKLTLLKRMQENIQRFLKTPATASGPWEDSDFCKGALYILDLWIDDIGDGK